MKKTQCSQFSEKNMHDLVGIVNGGPINSHFLAIALEQIKVGFELPLFRLRTQHLRYFPLSVSCLRFCAIIRFARALRRRIQSFNEGCCGLSSPVPTTRMTNTAVWKRHDVARRATSVQIAGLLANTWRLCSCLTSGVRMVRSSAYATDPTWCFTLASGSRSPIW